MIQSIDRAARVLFTLQGAHHMGITELAESLELAPSTVHGIVKSLASHGFVAKEPDGSRYVLGPALLKLSNVYLDSLDVRARAMRWTQELARRTGFAVRLGVPLFNEIIVIHHNGRTDGTEQMPETGISIPAHASALGKVLLAYHRDTAEEVLLLPLTVLTGDTQTDPDALRAEMDEIVRIGFATECDEAVLGESSAAAPIVDRDGAVIAAVAVVVPTTEWPVADDTLNALRETARNISREIGAARWAAAPVRNST